MRRHARHIAVAALLSAMLAMPVPAGAADLGLPANTPDSGELVSRMNEAGNVAAGLYWDGRTITFHGEAIGEAMVRGDHAWIHLNDGPYMESTVEEGAELRGYNSGVAVWVPASLIGRIDTYGDYKHQGTIVEVTGVFNGACSEHGGDTDLHATTLKVLRPGHVVVDEVHPIKVVVAAIMAFTAALLFVVERRYRNVIRPRGRTR